MSKRRKLFAFAIDEHLKAGLELVKERDGISESEQARRAIQAWLGDRKAIPAASGSSKPRATRRAKP